MARFRNLFFDLDDTLWAFSENARDTFGELYDRFEYGRFFRSFSHFYDLYTVRNLELWGDYAVGKVTKSELNRLRFLYPLQQVGVEDAALAKAFAEAFFAALPDKRKLVPHARETLDYLSARGYRLYILSNGFAELQGRKMRSSGIDHYFGKVVLSDDIGVLKPAPAIFHFAMSATQSLPEESLMIGDSWASDIVGARAAGIRQVFYDPAGSAELPFRPTYHIHDLRELAAFL